MDALSTERHAATMQLACHLYLIVAVFTQQISAVTGNSSLCSIEKCRCIGSSTLDCSHLALPHFSARSVKSHDEVEVLNLRDNHLREVPDLSSFPNLHTLDLSYNDISILPEGAFHNLSQLSHLDISFNKLVLSDETVHMKSFDGLTQLKSLRMKQRERPDVGFDYTAFGPLGASLEELFITGTQTLNLVNFTKLHTLSLGGSACNVTSLNATEQPTLTQLNLKRFSARNCGVKEINRQFLQSFTGTLQKLDLSCNHLKDFLIEITSGVAFSSLKVLILDHINKEGDDYCPWINVTEVILAGLRHTPLQVLSIQANQFGAQTRLDFRGICNDLIYLDISQNNFDSVGFRVAPFSDQPVPDADMNFFGNWDLHSPGLKYLGLQGLTNNFLCGECDPQILDCNEDSYLFLEDEYAWDHNYDPDILDPTLIFLLFKHISRFSECTFEQDNLDCVIHVATSIIAGSDNAGYVTDRIINKTIHHLWQRSGGISNAISYFDDLRYLFVNVTTFAFGYNNLMNEKDNIPSSFCTDVELYSNNVETIDLSYSVLHFVSCSNITGFNFLTNITCRECSCHGWNNGLFRNIPLKYLDVSRNHLGQRLRNDVKGEMFSNAPALETLLLGEQFEGGIKYFPSSAIFSILPNLIHLDLHNNRLTTWNVSITSNNNLSVLDLRNNQIGYIEEKFRREMENKTGLVVYLAGNDVTCSEANIDYLHWLLNSSFISDATEIDCLGNQQTVENYLKLTTIPPDATGKDDSDSGQIAAIVVTSCVTLAVVALLVIGWVNRYALIYRCCSYRHQRSPHFSEIASSDGRNEKLTVFASCCTEFTEKLAALQDQLRENQINLLSTELTILPGAMTRAVIPKLVAECQKVIIFLTVDYMKDETTPFEFEMIKQKGLQNVVLVSFGIDSANQIQHIPSALKDIVVNERHLVWPIGVCAGNDSNIQAFVTTLVDSVLQRSTEEMA